MDKKNWVMVPPIKSSEPLTNQEIENLKAQKEFLARLKAKSDFQTKVTEKAPFGSERKFQQLSGEAFDEAMRTGQDPHAVLKEFTLKNAPIQNPNEGQFFSGLKSKLGGVAKDAGEAMSNIAKKVGKAGGVLGAAHLPFQIQDSSEAIKGADDKLGEAIYQGGKMLGVPEDQLPKTEEQYMNELKKRLNDG